MSFMVPQITPGPFRSSSPGNWYGPPPVPGNPINPAEDYLLEDDRDVPQDLIKELGNEAGTVLDVKRLDMIWDPTRHSYDTRDTALTTLGQPLDSHEIHKEFAFVCRRKFEDEWKRKERETLPHPDGPVTEIEIKSPFLKYAAQQVIGKVPGVSWTAKPLIIDALTLVSYLDDFQRFVDDLRNPQNAEDPATVPLEGTFRDPQIVLSIVAHVDFLLEFLKEEFKDHIETLKSLLQHGEITFNMLFHILRPRTLLFTNCPITGAPRVVRLGKAQWVPQSSLWTLHTIYVAEDIGSRETTDRLKKYGWSSLALNINSFHGTKKISSLDAFPLNWHPNSGEITDQLVRRGEKWSSLTGVHHLHHRGFAYASPSVVGNAIGRPLSMDERGKVEITGRVMIDKAMYLNYSMDHHIIIPSIITSLKITKGSSAPTSATPHKDADWDVVSLLDNETKLDKDHLLLTLPFVYGYSLERKIWIELLVDNLEPIPWNHEAFRNLVLPQDQKELVKKLVQTHRPPSREGRTSAFDDFVRGKGRGLVIHLYGNPGVGKSMTAEATSEHLQKPLYMVGAGDLGTESHSVDRELTKVMNLATQWGAVLLIDEADVFLEKRSLKDLERNAMVAVFLRKLEYFGGILFMTTNMVESFDHAFQSRLHLSLLYPDLSPGSLRKIWVAFVSKAVEGQQQDASLPDAIQKSPIKWSGVTDKQFDDLCQVRINGRQIKNIVATATILANSKAELLGYEHLRSILDTAQHFQRFQLE